jgi:hypothetical protein
MIESPFPGGGGEPFRTGCYYNHGLSNQRGVSGV